MSDNKRPDFDRYYIEIAKVVSSRSTCLRRKYGAVLVKNNKIVSTGYNGSASGEINCIDSGYCERQKLGVEPGTRYELCLHGDTVIKLLDGTYKTIKELSEKETEFWVYSCDIDSGKIVPALAKFPRKTGERNDLLEITLDNGKSIKCTSDHKILMRDGIYKEAKYLSINDSLMPMYYNFSINQGYESISNTIKVRKEGKSKNWKFEFIGRTNSTPTHHLVYDFFYGREKNDIIHHKNEDKRNNMPSNLLKLDTIGEHSKLHPFNLTKEQQRENAKHLKKHHEENKFNEEYIQKKHICGKTNMTKNWNNEEFKNKMAIINKENGKKTALLTNSDPECIKSRQKGKILKSLLKLKEVSKTDINVNNYDEIKKEFIFQVYPQKIFSLKTINKYFENEDVFEIVRTYNHKVTSIKKIEGKHDVYDITVPNYENFAIDLGDNSCVFVHNCRSVHAEQNTLLSSSMEDAKDSTLYISGFNVEDNSIANSKPCMMCARFIKNAKIKRLVVSNEKDEIVELDINNLY